MAWKHHNSDEISTKLAAVETRLRVGAPIEEALAEIGISASTYWRWRRVFGGMNKSQMQMIKDMSLEITRLRRLVDFLAAEEVA